MQPIVNNDYIFLVTKDNFLVSIDLNSGEIIYSFEIDNKISKFLKTKKNKINIKFFKINK